ncbi:MAG: guanylate kinase [Candidatus Cloacimonetes bacterium]|nr:guanylate kinase [Candidatus Cloacimonadota bacterium]
MSYKRSSFLLILIAPSGGGKSTIGDRLLEKETDLVYSISSTTRSIRTGEKNGEDYYFLGEKEFLEHRAAGEFIETAQVHGNWYGTSRSIISSRLAEGKNILLDIDVQGALNILKQGIECVTVFILPPHQEILERRLIDRKTDDAATIELRLSNARKEIDYIKEFDYLVINDDLETAVAEVRLIIAAEQLRSVRYKNVKEEYYRSENA